MLERPVMLQLQFFFSDTAPSEISTLSLHDALPICVGQPEHACGVAEAREQAVLVGGAVGRREIGAEPGQVARAGPDRKSTRLNSSHPSISYAVFCLKKKKKT